MATSISALPSAVEELLKDVATLQAFVDYEDTELAPLAATLEGVSLRASVLADAARKVLASIEDV